MSFRQYTPAVPRHWLFAISGLLWSGVGLMLCALAGHWLRHSGWRALWVVVPGLSLALLAWRFMFRKLAWKNIARIEQRPTMTCLFAFQAWRSYGLMLFMIALGVLLRRSHASRHYLALGYIAIGGALFLASLSYHARFWRERKNLSKKRAV